MIPRPPDLNRTYTLLPYTTPFRSHDPTLPVPDAPPAAVQRVHRQGPIMSPGHSRFAVAPSGWTVLLSGRQAPPDHIGPGTRCLRPAIPSALRLRPQHNGAGSRRP